MEKNKLYVQIKGNVLHECANMQITRYGSNYNLDWPQRREDTKFCALKCVSQVICTSISSSNLLLYLIIITLRRIS